MWLGVELALQELLTGLSFDLLGIVLGTVGLIAVQIATGQPGKRVEGESCKRAVRRRGITLAVFGIACTECGSRFRICSIPLHPVTKPSFRGIRNKWIWFNNLHKCF